MPRGCRVIVQGRVQGVGFRPFIFSIANEFNIKGTVQNNMDGVIIQAEASEFELHSFIEAIENRPPRLSKIYSVVSTDVEVKGFTDFTIIPSERTGKASVVIPVDANICPDCRNEMTNPEDRRYNYPFINCTQCGPRYTIIRELPYDRPYTSMDEFKMCPDCLKEYNDPMNRRHHAQPNACPVCGPQYTLLNMNEEMIKGDLLESVIKLLLEGKILAIKGIGGYHLVCDALNDTSVKLLRARKNRPSKPLAIMTRDFEGAKEFCEVSNEIREYIESVEAPIVLLDKKYSSKLSDAIAPGLNTLGVMLPYAPFHHLLFSDGRLKALVMTSANPSGLPMLHSNEEAFSYLSEIADYVVSHNREILHPIDDSVLQWMNNKPYIIRRARGYVPDPMVAKAPVDKVIALGSQQKNTFALGRNEQIFVGPHIGDLGSIEVMNHYESELDHLNKWMGIDPKVVAVDLHPGFSTRELAEKRGYPIFEVQHHHAHMVSCMAENDILHEDSFGIILDGTGYGVDGNIWGFEVLEGNTKSFQRKAHLEYSPLPGGEKSILEPWKNAVGMLYSNLGEDGKDLAKRLFSKHENEIDILCTMIDKGINSPLAGTCGRLFDAVSAIMGISFKAGYDGEAAILLGEKANLEHVNKIEAFPFEINETSSMMSVNISKMLLEISSEVLKGEVSLEEISTRFHQTIIDVLSKVMETLKAESDNRNIVLSGGSFHNEYLLVGLKEKLVDLGFKVHTHRMIPTNDGGLSLGQLYIAAANYERGE